MHIINNLRIPRKQVNIVTYEPAHNKTFNKTCATSEDSAYPAHLRSLIKVFADRMCLLPPSSYLKRDKRESLQYLAILLIRGVGG